MSKILVTYMSQTGNTQKIAGAIHEALAGEKVIKPYTDVEEKEINSSDLVFIGFPVQAHGVPPRMEEFLRRIPKGKKIAIFCTHGSFSGTHLSREALQHAAVLAARAKVLGSFSCRGRVAPEVMETLSKSPEHHAWAEMAATARAHPDEHDIEDARAFARWIQTVHAQS